MRCGVPSSLRSSDPIPLPLKYPPLHRLLRFLIPRLKADFLGNLLELACWSMIHLMKKSSSISSLGTRDSNVWAASSRFFAMTEFYQRGPVMLRGMKKPPSQRRSDDGGPFVPFLVQEKQRASILARFK